MPVVTSQMKQANRFPATASRPLPQLTPPANTPRTVHKTASSGSSLNGFSSNPFSLKHKDEKTPLARKKPQKVIYGPGQDQQKPFVLDKDGKVVLSAREMPDKDDRLTPRRSTFSGGTHTIPNMDKKPAPEVSMNIEGENGTSTRLIVNPQDEASPLYRPPEPEGALNSAGVYMDVEVKPNVKLQLGGEYCDLDDPKGGSEEASAGAAVGLKWSF